VVLEVRDGKTLGRFAGGRERPIFWPPGFTLVEDASLWRIVTPDGRLFATSGEDITAFMLSGQWRGWHACVASRSIAVY